jgi:hypothetical protein
MFHLTSETTMERVQGALIRAREFQVAAAGWWWNMLGILFVVGSMALFLYSRAVTPPPEEVKRIEFKPQVWYSATRNIRSEEWESQMQPV